MTECSNDGCGYFAGPGIGYCRRFRVVMASEDVREFYSKYCSGEPGDMGGLARETYRYLTRVREK